MTNAISTLVGPRFEGRFNWRYSVVGADGCVYGIPCCARGVVKFNPIDKTLTAIGLDLGDREYKYNGGVLAKNGCIYCVPCNSNHILKIDTINGTVSLLLDVELPETGSGRWNSGALALDDCIYYIPYSGRRILKLNPEDDTVSIVGDDLGVGFKCHGTVVDNDGYVYGIPKFSKRVIKFDPRNRTTSFVGEEADDNFNCGNGGLGFNCGNGTLGRDGLFIYAATGEGHVLIIDVKNNTYSVLENTHPHYSGWESAISGNDGCIYWPAQQSNHVLKLDPKTNDISLVGDDLGNHICKWSSGAVTSDGVIYCMPFNSNRVLSIDPLKSFTNDLQNNMEQHPEYPEKLGFLFQRNSAGETLYETSVRKFGMEQTFQILEECLPQNELDQSANLYPFMIAASFENSAVAVVYYLLRKNPAFLCCSSLNF